MSLFALQVLNLLNYNILIYMLFVSVENTRTVSKNLGCKTVDDYNMNANRVDVLIPDVIQVLSASSF